MNNHDDDKLGDWMKLGIYFVLMGLFVLLLAGCTTVPLTPTPTTTTGWNYDNLIRQNLTPAMKSAVPGALCPNGANAEDFWPALFQATAHEESNYNLRLVYTEPVTKDNTGAPQKSQGLMQISLDDQHRGTHCKPINASTILEAEPNLLCAVDIMDELIKRDEKGSLQADLGMYWSTIAKGKILASLKALLPACFSAQNDKLEMMDAGEEK